MERQSCTLGRSGAGAVGRLLCLHSMSVQRRNGHLIQLTLRVGGSQVQTHKQALDAQAEWSASRAVRRARRPTPHCAVAWGPASPLPDGSRHAALAHIKALLLQDGPQINTTLLHGRV